MRSEGEDREDNTVELSSGDFGTQRQRYKASIRSDPQTSALNPRFLCCLAKLFTDLMGSAGAELMETALWVMGSESASERGCYLNLSPKEGERMTPSRPPPHRAFDPNTTKERKMNAVEGTTRRTRKTGWMLVAGVPPKVYRRERVVWRDNFLRHTSIYPRLRDKTRNIVVDVRPPGTVGQSASQMMTTLWKTTSFLR